MKECNGLGDMNAINKIIVDSLRIDRFVFQNGEDPVTGVLFFKIERKEKNERSLHSSITIRPLSTSLCEQTPQ